MIIFEFDNPLIQTNFLPAEAGIYAWRLTNDLPGFYDDYSVLGYYEYQNSTRYSVNSMRVNETIYDKMTSMADMRLYEESFYYDTSSTILYIHNVDFNPFLSERVVIGVSSGYSLGATDPYFNGGFYPPLLKSCPVIKQSIDPLFFGMLKFQSVSPSLDNLPVSPSTTAEFDDWRTKNAFGQAARLLSGDDGDTYANLEPLISGFIEDDKTTFSSFSVTIQDLRKSLSQQVATNKYLVADYPYLNDSDKNKVKPVCYGDIFNGKTICLNSEQTTSTYTFHFADVTYNAPTAVTKVYVDGVDQTASATVTLSTGTFTLPKTICAPDDSLLTVTVDFTAGTIINGVDILKDLMLNYDGKTYIASFWNLTEVAAAEALCRDTSLYIDDTKSLAKAVESVCIDCDLRFFVKRDGTYTVRIFDENRATTKTIKTDDWLSDPDISNNGSEYLTSCVIKYHKDRENDEYYTYDSSELLNGATTYKEQAFAIYKKHASKEFETNLTTEADAIAKATTILNYSTNVQDSISRKLPWEYRDMEICDFIICSPKTRIGQVEDLGVYEVLGTSLDPIKKEIEITIRKISGYTPVVYENAYRVTSDGDIRCTDEYINRITTELV